MQDGHARQDDSFMRKVMAALVVALLTQGAGWIYLLGTLSNQIENNGENIVRNAKDIEKLQSLNDRLVRIEVKMDAALSKLSKIEK